jgi:hypothetical protein
MNIEELREQLAQAAGPEPRATSEARDAVRGRVRRHRTRVGVTSALASVLVVALVVAIVGAGLHDSVNSDIVLRTTPSTTAPVGCASGIGTTPAKDVPTDVRAWAHGKPVVGHGELWTLRSAIAADTLMRNSRGEWWMKIEWFTRSFRQLTIFARRLDGAGGSRAGISRAADQNGTRFTSNVGFAGPGCWEVNARSKDSAITFRILVGHPPVPLAIGTIAGTLREVGGPAPGLNRTIPGDFVIESGSEGDANVYCSRNFDPPSRRCFPPITGATNAGGTFTVDVPVGRYTVSGTSPKVQFGTARCHASSPVVVTRGHTTRVDIVCQIR